MYWVLNYAGGMNDLCFNHAAMTQSLYDKIFVVSQVCQSLDKPAYSHSIVRLVVVVCEQASGGMPMWMNECMLWDQSYFSQAVTTASELNQCQGVSKLPCPSPWELPVLWTGQCDSCSAASLSICTKKFSLRFKRLILAFTFSKSTTES